MSNIKMRKLVLVFIWLSLVVAAYGEGPIVQLETNFGNIVIELFDDQAPVTVDNFLTYVKSGFYDGLIFHRVIENFMIQGGGFDTSLNKLDTLDPIINESNNGLNNLRGTVAMARTDEPNSATSQFYINVVDNAFLDYNDINDVGYCVFGQVISGMDVVDRIVHLPTQNGVTVPVGGTMNNVPRPPGPVIIYNAKILGDLDRDTDVDFRDYGVFADQWLDGGNSDLFKITDGNAGDWFGYSVAVDANHAVIGAPGDSGNIGAAYIFECNDGIWTEKAKLTAFDGGEVGDYFGVSVAISANYAIVGAVGDDNYMGAAYLFDNNDGSWEPYGKLLPYDDDIDDQFGRSVAISGDCAVVGAWLNDAAGLNTGSVYVFYRNQDGTGYWGQQAKLEASDAAKQDRFGYSVAINGEFILVGAIGDDSFKGSAYVFKYKNSAWTQLAKLTASDGASSDKFGTSVSTDGYYAIVGARLNDEKDEDAGAAYIFEPNAIDPNNWDQKTKLTASDAAANDYFGYSVAIGSSHAIVGAYGNDDSGGSSGSAYIFEPNEINPDNWDQSAKLTASDPNAGDYFGFSVAVGMGRQAIVGAHANDDNGTDSGSAYILDLCPDADLDGDCSVTLYDLAILTDNWLLH